MFRNEEEVKKKFNEFLESLIDTAMEDQKISSDEQVLIDCIKEDIEDLEEQIMQILSDDLDDTEFRDLMTQFMGDIIDHATKVANEDEEITEEESKLLNHLKEFAKVGVMGDYE